MHENIFAPKIKISHTNPFNGDKKNSFPKPDYATDGAAGLDLRACLKNPMYVYPNNTAIIGSGIAIAIDNPNIAAVLLPRSGLGIKHGIVLANLIGLIDSDYREEIKIAIWNRSDKLFVINHNDRICQMVFVPIIKPEFEWVPNLESNGRGGLGSTGIE